MVVGRFGTGAVGASSISPAGVSLDKAPAARMVAWDACSDCAGYASSPEEVGRSVSMKSTAGLPSGNALPEREGQERRR
jgi:hypothetical protein